VSAAAPGVAVHAYPWDVLDGGGASAAARDLGAGVVHLAAAYHAVRAATPTHPRRRVVEAVSSALYTAAHEEVWSGAALVPPAADAWAGPDSYGRAQEALRADGLRVRAWLALSHVDGIGGARGECVITAFGDVLPHALCPSRPAVRDYATRLVTQVVRARPDGLVVEACGQLGLDHAPAHDKTAGADWTAGERALLSVCVCAACRAGWVARGLAPGDAGAVPGRVRAAVVAGGHDLRSGLGPAAEVVLGHRRAVAASLLDEVVVAAAAGGVDDVAVHVSPDDASTSPASPVLPDAGGPGWAGGPTAVAHCWGPDGAAAVRAVAARAGAGARVAAYTTVLPPAPEDDVELARRWGGLLAAGADELHVYHLGLASRRRLERASGTLRRLGAPAGPGTGATGAPAARRPLEEQP